MTGVNAASAVETTGPVAGLAGRDTVTERGGQTVCLPSREASCYGQRALWAWSPPPLPAGGALARRVDRLMPRTGVPAVLSVAGIVALLNLAPLLPDSVMLAGDGTAFLAAGGWCALNFWRCRHAHCLISGAGWIGLGVLAFVEAGLGRSMIDGYEQPALVTVPAVAVAFEGAWYLARGTNAVTSGPQMPAGRRHAHARHLLAEPGAGLPLAVGDASRGPDHPAGAPARGPGPPGQADLNGDGA